MGPNSQRCDVSEAAYSPIHNSLGEPLQLSSQLVSLHTWVEPSKTEKLNMTSSPYFNKKQQILQLMVGKHQRSEISFNEVTFWFIPQMKFTPKWWYCSIWLHQENCHCIKMVPNVTSECLLLHLLLCVSGFKRFTVIPKHQLMERRKKKVKKKSDYWKYEYWTSITTLVSSIIIQERSVRRSSSLHPPPPHTHTHTATNINAQQLYVRP